MTAYERADKAARLELGKSIKLLRQFVKNKKFMAQLAEEGRTINLDALDAMEKLHKKIKKSLDKLKKS